MGTNQSLLDKHGYKKIKEAGEGGFGRVTIVQSKADGKKVAIKEVQSNRMAKKEMSILKNMKHPNIVHYFDSFEGEGKLYIVMEYCDGGDLCKEIEDQKEKGIYFQECKIIEWFVQICLALKYVHDKRVIHRDIKPQNIFLTKAGKIKLGDFGISKQCPRADGFTDTVIGTPLYMATEVLNRQPYTNKCDMWSLGCVLYELCMLERPMGKHSILKSYSSELQDLVMELLKKNPADRPSVKDVLKKPFIKHHITQCNTTKVTENVEMQQRVCITDNDFILTEWSEEEASDSFEFSSLLLRILYKASVGDLQTTIKYLYDLADQLENTHKKSTIGSLSGSVVGAAGGITSIVGLILTPFTLGASLIVTGVGIGVAVAGGLGGAASNITGKVLQSKIRETVEERCKKFETQISPMITSLSEIERCNTFFNKKANDSSSTIDKRFLRAGKVVAVIPAIVRLVQVASIGRVAAQAAKTVRVASALTGVLSGLFLIMDVAFIAVDAREIHEMNNVTTNKDAKSNTENTVTGTDRAELLERGEEKEGEAPRSNTLKLIKAVREAAAQYQTTLDELKSVITEIDSEETNAFVSQVSQLRRSSLSLPPSF